MLNIKLKRFVPPSAGLLLDEIAEVEKGWGMTRRWIVVLAVNLLCASALSGEAESGHFRRYLASYPFSVKEAATAPARWQAQDWLTAGGVVLVAGSLVWADPQIRDFTQNHRIGWNDAALHGLGYAGDKWILFPAAGVTALAGCLAGSDKSVDTGLLCLKSMLLASAASEGLKLASQRQRPGGASDGDFWPEGGFSLRHDSFPSGHSTLVWSVAPVLAEQYSEQAWVAPLVYGLAVLASWSRVNGDEHWASDVFCGAAIGYLSARLTLNSTPRMALTPAPDLKGIKLSLEF